MTAPVSQRRIDLATKAGIVCAPEAAAACRVAGLSFPAACALLMMESSGGKNIYGHDAGGALSGYSHPVDKSNYFVFYWLVKEKGWLSNGVGPCQITYFGYHDQMLNAGKKPWDITDNMEFGFDILARDYESRLPSSNAWQEAATLYNAGNLKNGINDYGRKFYKIYTDLRLALK